MLASQSSLVITLAFALDFRRRDSWCPPLTAHNRILSSARCCPLVLVASPMGSWSQTLGSACWRSSRCSSSSCPSALPSAAPDTDGTPFAIVETRLRSRQGHPGLAVHSAGDVDPTTACNPCFWLVTIFMPSLIALGMGRSIEADYHIPTPN